MEYIVLIVLLYMGIKHLLQVIELVCIWIYKYRDAQQSIARVRYSMAAEYSTINEKDAHEEWLSFARRHGINMEE